MNDTFIEKMSIFYQQLTQNCHVPLFVFAELGDNSNTCYMH